MENMNLKEMTLEELGDVLQLIMRLGATNYISDESLRALDSLVNDIIDELLSREDSDPRVARIKEALEFIRTIDPFEDEVSTPQAQNAWLN